MSIGEKKRSIGDGIIEIKDHVVRTIRQGGACDAQPALKTHPRILRFNGSTAAEQETGQHHRQGNAACFHAPLLAKNESTGKSIRRAVARDQYRSNRASKGRSFKKAQARNAASIRQFASMIPRTFSKNLCVFFFDGLARALPPYLRRFCPILCSLLADDDVLVRISA
jgi:hypothetical protein